MGFYIGQGTGKQLKSWKPGEPGIPTHADTAEELKAYSPQLGHPCSSEGCWREARWKVTRKPATGIWYWARQRQCRFCENLRYKHGLTLGALVGLWEEQQRACYSCGVSLPDPTVREDFSFRTGAVIDHDHDICSREDHSCDQCRRGLACSSCNVGVLACRNTSLLDQKPTFWLAALKADSLADAASKLRKLADQLEGSPE